MVKYKNGNVYVSIDENTGTKIRFSKEDDFHPSFAESMDVSITQKCSQLCNFCYLGCTPKGKHADLMSDYVVNTFIPSLHPYTELALNGNDLDNPTLLPFLEMLKAQKVFANITVNQNQFMYNKYTLAKWQEEGLIHGIGISYKKYDGEFFLSLSEVENVVIHVVAGIFSEEDLYHLAFRDLNLLILGYKNMGRGKEYYEHMNRLIADNQDFLKRYLITKAFYREFKGIGFDTLACKQLDIKFMLSKDEWETMYQGDDGSFTFYVDLVNNHFAKSSTSNFIYDIKNHSVDDMFNSIRGLSNAKKGVKN